MNLAKAPGHGAYYKGYPESVPCNWAAIREVYMQCLRDELREEEFWRLRLELEGEESD